MWRPCNLYLQVYVAHSKNCCDMTAFNIVSDHPAQPTATVLTSLSPCRKQSCRGHAGRTTLEPFDAASESMHMRTAHGKQEDLVDNGWSRSPLMRVFPGRNRSTRRTRHRSSYMPHVFVHVHVQNEGLACKVSAVGC